MSDPKDILGFDGSEPKRLTEERLQAYLEGKLSASEMHEVEQWLSEEGMESDALEGLNNLPASQTHQSVHRINRQLHKELNAKKKHRRRGLRSDQWAWTAIMVVLLLCILAYALIYLAAKR